MNPHIARVVPDMLSLDFEGEIMCGFFPVVFSVSAFVPTAAYAAADEADPEIVCRVADTAEGGFTAAERGVVWVVRVRGGVWRGK